MRPACGLAVLFFLTDMQPDWGTWWAYVDALGALWFLAGFINPHWIDTNWNRAKP